MATRKLTAAQRRQIEGLRAAANLIETGPPVRANMAAARADEIATELAHLAYVLADAAGSLLGSCNAYLGIERAAQIGEAVTAFVHAEDLAARLRDRKGYRGDLVKRRALTVGGGPR